ncbi:MAG: hypothetical protein AAF993_15855 [Pseudomonadota bacterium]
MQTQLLQRWLNAGEHIGGWKIGMTSGASRNAMGDGIRPFGFVLKSRIVESGSILPVQPLHRGQVENELCFVMQHALGADATPESAQAAVGGILPAFEINQKRLPADVSAGVRVADNLSNWGIAIGAAVAPIRDLSALEVTLSNTNGDVIEQVPSAGHIDDHYLSLATLAQRLAAFGQQLQPGQFVITGAYGKTPFAPGAYQGRFSLGIGDVEIQLQ